MISAAVPANEMERLLALHAYKVLDTDTEAKFDAITRMAALVCDVPIALISLVDANRQWFKSVVGLDATETKREASFCAHAIHANQIMEVADTLKDDRFCDNPLVVGDDADCPHIRFYAGSPLITPERFGLGTLCVIDRAPRQLTAKQRSVLAELSLLAMHLLDDQRAHAESIALLQSRNEMLTMGERTAQVGHWFIDTKRRLFWSDELYRIHGRSRDEGLPGLQEAVGWYHPDDWETIIQNIESAFDTGAPFAFDLRFQRPDGVFRDLSTRAEAQRGPDGKVMGIFGITQDCTNWRETERDRTRLRGTAELDGPALRRLMGVSFASG